MALIDIAALYKHVKKPSKPFSYFFKSRGYTLAYNYLRETKNLPESSVLIRSMPSRSNPSVAKVHPLIAVEFLRWIDYGTFHDQVEKWITKH